MPQVQQRNQMLVSLPMVQHLRRQMQKFRVTIRVEMLTPPPVKTTTMTMKELRRLAQLPIRRRKRRKRKLRQSLLLLRPRRRQMQPLPLCRLVSLRRKRLKNKRVPKRKNVVGSLKRKNARSVKKKNARKLSGFVVRRKKKLSESSCVKKASCLRRSRKRSSSRPRHERPLFWQAGIFLSRLIRHLCQQKRHVVSCMITRRKSLRRNRNKNKNKMPSQRRQ